MQTDSPNVASQSSVANVVCHNVPNMDDAIAMECCVMRMPFQQLYIS